MKRRALLIDAAAAVVALWGVVIIARLLSCLG